MPNSVLKQIGGPDWPLGQIVVPTPGTPVGIMSLVDPTSVNAPQTQSSASSLEYTPARAMDIIITPVHSLAPFVANTGVIYLLRKNSATVGTGNRADPGVIVLALTATAGPFHLSHASSTLEIRFNGYDYFLDADTASDGALITLLL